MKHAEHIIGLSAIERARKDAQAARRRYEEVIAAGVLRPRGDGRRGLHDAGSTFTLDTLAGDGRYVFLSLGARYRTVREPELCYGFVFDAEQLIRAGALVGPDLLGDYEEIADRIARRMEVVLPAAPPSAEEPAEFAALFGADDPGMLAAMREMNRSNYWDLLDVLEHGDEEDPIAAEARRLFRVEAAAVQARRRVGGEAALARVCRQDERLEIVYPGEIPLAWAIGYIEAGVPVP